MMIMNFAIKQLEDAENILKETIDNLGESEVEALDLRGKLVELQTAILVINASQELVNIGKVQALKNL